MDDEPAGVTSLPMTVAGRRNARLRSAALATIPLLLFIVAAAPRVWAPDLVPFGEPQAAYVLDAIHPASSSPIALYTDPTVSLLAVVDPMWRTYPEPVAVWVVFRGVLDAVGVSLLYIAARSAVGVWPALLAALLYAVNPLAWAEARNPAGSLGAVLATSMLLPAVGFAQRRTWRRAIVLGLIVLLVGTPALLRIGIHQIGWSGVLLPVVPVTITIGFAIIPFLLVLPMASRNRVARWSGFACVLLLGIGATGVAVRVSYQQEVDRSLRLRDWSMFAGAIRETVSRTGNRDVVMPRGVPGDQIVMNPLRAMLRDDVSIRRMPDTPAVLPLERESAFVLLFGAPSAIELERPSSLTTISTPDDHNTFARIVTLRGRPAGDWLARVNRVEDGGFADGSRLLGVTYSPTRDGGVDVALYWQLPVTSDGRSPIGLSILASVQPPFTPAHPSSLPVLDTRRSNEIVETSVHFSSWPDGTGARTMQVALHDAAGTIVRTSAGAVSLDVPTGTGPR